MLFYIIEGAVPVLTWFLVVALIRAFAKDYERHQKTAKIHALLTLSSCALVFILVRLGHSLDKGSAPEWILTVHLIIIYLMIPSLVALMVTGSKRIRAVHVPLAYFYTVNWVLALVTGCMIFLFSKGYI